MIYLSRGGLAHGRLCVIVSRLKQPVYMWAGGDGSSVLAHEVGNLRDYYFREILARHESPDARTVYCGPEIFIWDDA